MFQFRRLAAQYKLELKVKTILGLIFALHVGLFALKQSPFNLFLDKNFSLKVNFKIRSWLDKSPKLDPRIKIYGFDDGTLEYLDREDLSLTEWGQLIKAMATAGAAGIYIDKLFGTPDNLDAELPEFTRRLQEAGIPVVTAAWITEHQVKGRDPHPLQQEHFSLASRSDAGDTLPSWLQYEARFMYGPHRRLIATLQHTGHAIYRGEGEVEALVRIQPDKAVPHWSLIGRNSYSLQGDRLMIHPYGSDKSRSVPLTSRSTVLVNFLDEGSLRAETYSLRNSIIRTKQGLSFANAIEPGQLIVILPAMYTGNTDMVATPVGYIPGGYVMVSMLNSVLSGQWIQPFQAEGLAVTLAIAAGAVLGLAASPLIWISLLILGSLSISVAFLLAFAFWGLAANWCFIILVFAFASLVFFAIEWHLKTLKSREHAAQQDAMQQAAQAVQESFISPLGHFPGIASASYYKSADATGGDWYGLYPSPDQKRLYIFIGDVTGHGFSSALLTGAVAGAIYSQLQMNFAQPRPMETELQEMADLVNRLVFAVGSRSNRSLTMNFFCCDFSLGKYCLVNAAHPSPLRYDLNKVSSVLSRGSILGMSPDFVGEARTYDLVPGETLFFFTDGLLENAGPGGERLKPRQIWEILKQGQLSPQDKVNAIVQLGETVWKDQNPADDCTFVAIQIESGQAA
ncbi:MAG TPA: SpoIIE family protein phosphatase [Oligoflexus sp.]|uniref:SpoIIE family protein phosphatase n=1 Tax=Oligoflexus sp. TaxID=1971216 RepID=UPI002D2659BC|nr:SpoIIE family protein phosphatase [Oligoflexus sp.]HYX34996.1 SpoIIE family protein phosphatase [Oligoflexus sp.]